MRARWLIVAVWTLATAVHTESWAGGPPTTAMEPVRPPMTLDGSWTGLRNGEPVLWELDSDGRLRIDGRGADYTVRGDSILVIFDSLDPNSPPETAVYRFTPEVGKSRLFVYGFDLGKQGVVLHRARDLASEDAAPPIPALTPVPPAIPAAPSPPGPAQGPVSPQPGAR